MSTSARGGAAVPWWSSPRRVFASTLVGVFLLQAGWIMTLPAFGGMDEFDHVFKAASVARGHVTPGPPTAEGRGGQVVVPEDVVDAASAMCDSYPYTGRDNCHPVRHLDDGNVTVDSGAASYNPVYYAVVGALSRPFHGADVDVVARFVTAFLAAALLAWAAAVTRRRSDSAWPLLALVLVVTPTLIYSSAVTSPNGVGYAAGALVWSAALGFVTSDEPPELAAFSTGAVALLVSHSTALVWLPLIALAVFLLQPRARWWSWVGRHRRRVLAAGSIVAVTAIACALWIVTQKTNAVEVDEFVARQTWPVPSALVGQWVVWCLQTVGAFPIRDQPAPLFVYPMWLVPLGVLMVLGWRAGGRREHIAMSTLAVAWLLIPTAATIATYAALGYAWQGRYALPLAAGLPMLAAHALATRGRHPRRSAVHGTLLLCTLAQAVCVASVAARGQRTAFAPSVVPGDAGVVLATMLALAGGGLLWWGIASTQRTLRARPPAGTASPARSRGPGADSGGQVARFPSATPRSS